MYAQLGNIQFELLPITGLDERYAYDFAEHQVIEGKPLLQFIGDKLDEANISIRLHRAFCDPQFQFDALKAQADLHQALPFLFATGKFLGYYVVCEITKTTVKTFADGAPLCIEGRLQLKEWVDTNPLGTRQAAQQKSAPGLAGKGPVAVATAAPGNTRAIVAGQLKSGAAQMGATAGKISSLGDRLKSGFGDAAAAIADQVQTATAGISAALAPVTAMVQDLASGVQGAAAIVQGQIQTVAGLSSNITRILSGLPGPAGRLGCQMEQLNRDISRQATDGITLCQLIQGDSIEAGTRAQMITRMLPAVKVGA